MEGLLDHTLRDILTRFGGIDWCVSEFIRITGTRLPHRTFHRLLPELTNGSRTPAGTPVRAQILGSDPASMANNAARLAELGPFGVDINFGCPAKTVNRHGGGATLLDTPQTLERIVRSVRNALPPNIVVSAKMRLGVCDDTRAEECARAIEAGGASELVVHARTKLQGYQPPAHWHRIQDIKKHVRLRVIANGDIWTVQDALACKRASGCEDLMLGRGMVSNPGLANAIRIADAQAQNRSTRSIHPVPWEKIRPALLEFWESGEELVPWEARAGRLKQWLTHLKRHFPEAAQLFTTLRAERNPDTITKTLKSVSPPLQTPEPPVSRVCSTAPLYTNDPAP
jgi:tRNA-dihydrouridine synthase C